MEAWDLEMVEIPPGSFRMGTSAEEARILAAQFGFHVSWFDGEIPEREVDLPAYAIDRYPVTNRRFALFCRATGHPAPAHWGGSGPPGHLLDHPVVMVNHEDAAAFARWEGKRLPTEAEWEKAARGTGGRRFPWGDDFMADACCWNRNRRNPPGTVSVRAHPGGATPRGICDMAGNVAEWCADELGPGTAVIKGGCWLTTSVFNLRPAARNMSGSANNRSIFYGFRCAKGIDS